jgi:hypothetical protein
MKNSIFILLIGVLLFACGPAAKQKRSERRLAKLIEKNPSLVKTDTIWADTLALVPKISDSIHITTSIDSAAVDSLTDHFSGRVDSTILDSLNKGFKDILGKSGDIDTNTITKTKAGTIRTHIRKKNGVLDVVVEVDPEPVKIKYPKIINKVQPVKYERKKWYEWGLSLVGKEKLTVFGSIFLAFIIFLIYRFIRKYLLS